MIYNSLTFWTLLVGLIGFAIRFYYAAFPLDNVSILALVLFALGLIGVVPAVRARGALEGDIIHSLAFWQLVAGFLVFVVHFFAPALPIDNVIILGIIMYVLSWFGVKPELKARLTGKG
jgi:hypothetical protein